MHKYTKKRAFSLMETTISLIVVGVLLASLSPVITKKIQGTSVIAGAGANSNGRTFTADPSDPDCQNATDGSNAVDCKIQIPAGVDMINASLLSGGGGGASSTSSVYLANQILQSTSANNVASLTITNGMKNFKITNLTGAGGGGGGANSYQYQANKDTLVTSSSFTIPSGMTNVRAQLMGSGGGGGASTIYSTVSQKDIVKWFEGETVTEPKQESSGTIVVKPMAPTAATKNIPLTQDMTNVRVYINSSGGAGGYPYQCTSGSSIVISSGGGGGSGAYMAKYVPNSYITNGGRIEGNARQCRANGTISNCTAAGPGTGGASCSSYVYIKDSAGNMVYGFNVYGGEGGKSGSSSAGGAGGKGSSTCQLYTKESGWNNVTCNNNGHNGGAGERKTTNVITCSGKATGGKSGEALAGVLANGSAIYTNEGTCSNPSTYASSCGEDIGVSKESSNSCRIGWGGGARGHISSVTIMYDIGSQASSSGGGGGGGARLNQTVPDTYLTAGGTISLSVGTCAAGSGGSSCAAQLKTSSGYILQAYGGGAGGNASSSAAGTGGSGSSTCRKYVNGWSNITCSANGKNGTAGSIQSSLVSLSGGIGGNGADNNATGKGGNGGGTTSSGTTTNASSGNAGYARFYYDRYIPAPISGGGGGSGAVLTNISIPQSIIDSNIGGKIEIKSGRGGAFGSARNNGSAGSESYVVVKNSAGKIVWGYQALGGAGGGAATTAVGGAGGNGGTCQFFNGSSWTTTSCSSGGAKGGNGNKSPDGSAVAAGAAKGSGYGASGAGAVNISSNGGSGSVGIAQVSYDRYFQAAAGGGGGAGAYAQIKGIKVIPLKTYSIRIGKGGNAGSIGTKGQDGGMSYVTFEGTTHYASGGEGGKPGTAQTISNNVAHGTGGTYGKITSNTSGITFKNGTSGANGISSGFNSSGGNGGTSGVDSKGACGGMFINASICQNNSIHGQTLTFKLPRNINKTPTMGLAGAGGAGGGWNSANYNQTGAGSKGLDGYVYIWWQTFK